jgi:hypothetical protein
MFASINTVAIRWEDDRVSGWLELEDPRRLIEDTGSRLQWGVLGWGQTGFTGRFLGVGGLVGEP